MASKDPEKDTMAANQDAEPSQQQYPIKLKSPDGREVDAIDVERYYALKFDGYTEA